MPTDKQRRENERRRLQRQLARRRERDERRRRLTLIASVVGTLAVIGVVIGLIAVNTGGDGTPAAGAKKSASSSATAPSATPSSSASAQPVAAYPCTWTKSGTAAKKVSVPPTTRPPRTGTIQMAVQTSQGAMTFTLNRKQAPCASESFLSLAMQKYFDNTPCHRLTSGGLSVLQCGDPTGSGSGGPGYSFGDELSGKEQYTRGVLAMANSGPDTNGSQFFIVYKNSQLPASYMIFGTVSKGLGVVDKVAAKGVSGGGTDGKPALPISLQTVREKG